jgi:hypothetical protein
LAIIYFLGKATTRFPWIETATVVATVLAVIGLITGILFSRPAWNAWWVWDPKHTVVLLNTLVLLGISPLAAFTRLCSNPVHRNVALIVLLFVAVALSLQRRFTLQRRFEYYYDILRRTCFAERYLAC